MNELDIAKTFIDASASTRRVKDLTAEFETALQRLGFRYYACGSHVDPMNPEEAVMVLNYPQSWVETYSELQLHRVDPVFRRADRSIVPFFWDAADFKTSITSSQHKMLALARRFGVAHGYTIPIHGPAACWRPPSSCSLIPDSRTLGDAAYLAAQLMAYHLFDRAERLLGSSRAIDIPRLSPRERQCLALVGEGKCDWTISRLLGLSMYTVHNHIERAKRRLRVGTRIQAVVRALISHQITFADVIRPSQSDARRLTRKVSRRSPSHKN
jgi:DNA-binding CsgD family transcriptional regulator